MMVRKITVELTVKGEAITEELFMDALQDFLDDQGWFLEEKLREEEEEDNGFYYDES